MPARPDGLAVKIYPENIPTVFKDKVVAVDLITIYTAKGSFMGTWQAKDFRTELYQGIKKKAIRKKNLSNVFTSQRFKTGWK